MKPGATTRSAASITRAAPSVTRPTSAILPFAMATSARRAGSPVPSTSVPFLITRSKVMTSSSRDVLSFDDLIRPAQQRLWDGQAERPRRLHVDHELELLGPLDGKDIRLRSVEDPRQVDGTAAVGLSHARPIGEEAPGFRELREESHRGQSPLASQGSDARTAGEYDRGREDEDPACSPAASRLQRRLELRHGAALDVLDLEAEGRCRPVRLAELRRVAHGIADQGDTRNAGHHLADELKLLAAQLGKVEEDSGDVASGTGKGLRVSQRDGIALQIEGHDGDRGRGPRRRGYRVWSPREDHVGPAPEQVARNRGKASGLATAVLLHDGDLLAFRKPHLGQILLEDLVETGRHRRGTERTDLHPLRHRLAVSGRRDDNDEDEPNRESGRVHA